MKNAPSKREQNLETEASSSLGSGSKIMNINFRKEKVVSAIIVLFILAIFFGIKEFSEYVWYINESDYTPYQTQEEPKVKKEEIALKKLLPESRIIAYYGNLLSKGMGILGEYDEEEVLRRLKVEVDKWNDADKEVQAIPALHYIVTVAQADPGRDGKYRLRMPEKEIEKVLAMAKKINALVFLDIQVGRSSVEVEVPKLKKYLELPQVHLGLDPEFAMNADGVPGKLIGKMDASSINFAINYLSDLTKEHKIPPKIVVIHRFTDGMITNYSDIKPTEEVSVVINMDGFGHQDLKRNTYRQYVGKNPIEYTGFKIFYKNDTWSPGSRVMQPEDVLKLNPKPLYIQYQ